MVLYELTVLFLDIPKQVTLFVGVKLQLKVFGTKGELKTITQKRHKAQAEGVYSTFLEVQYSAPIKSPIGVGRRGGGTALTRTYCCRLFIGILLRAGTAPYSITSVKTAPITS